MKLSKYIWAIFCAAILIIGNDSPCHAQYVEIVTNPPAEKPKDSVVPAKDYEKLFEQNPTEYFDDYLKLLKESKKYKVAEKIINERLKIEKNSFDPLLHIELGLILQLDNKIEKAAEQFNKALQLVNGDDFLTQRIAKKFTENNLPDYAITTYERASEILVNPSVYVNSLARLYAKNGHLDKAMELLFSINPIYQNNVENAKAFLLELIGNDAEKLKQLQKLILTKINLQPENNYYVELLTWINIQKDDWDGALLQLEALDERNRESGRRLVNFARQATNEKKYEYAEKAYNDVITKGRDNPFYRIAQSEVLSCGLARLKYNPSYTKGETDSLLARFDSFLKELPMAYTMQTVADYAEILANYAHDVNRAIQAIETALARPDIKRDFAGTLKLQMGDFYLMQGKIWDASLTYSQVDKEFKQGMMGEDARFRNAKLAYYRGDFDWAQRQLLILKSATSELVANDALFLSVQITENLPDSNKLPLQRFAYAGLLVAQNKDDEAVGLYDSIAKAYPQHALNDDILLEKAKIAVKHHKFENALALLDSIYKKYGDDVLADDALFKSAEIYQYDLNNKEKALKFYEQLIIEYPGSTFVQTARQRLYDMKHPTAP